MHAVAMGAELTCIQLSLFMLCDLLEWRVASVWHMGMHMVSSMVMFIPALPLDCVHGDCIDAHSFHGPSSIKSRHPDCPPIGAVFIDAWLAQLQAGAAHPAKSRCSKYHQDAGQK